MSRPSRLLLLDTNIVILLCGVAPSARRLTGDFSFALGPNDHWCQSSHWAKRWRSLGNAAGALRGSSDYGSSCVSWCL